MSSEENTVYPSFRLHKTVNGAWRWVYYGKSQQPVAVSAETFRKYLECVKAIGMMKASESAPIYCDFKE